MDTRPLFMEDNVADSLYSGKLGGLHFHSAHALPYQIRDWVFENYPGTTHVRIGPTCGMDPKMEWLIMGWTNPTENDMNTKPFWERLIYTKWRKI